MLKQELVFKTVLISIAVAAVAALGYIALGALVLEPSQPAANEPHAEESQEEKEENRPPAITDRISGSNSSINEPGMVVFNSPEEARERLGADFIWDTPAARELDIDWEQEMAVAVFLGSRNSGGHSVEIQGIDVDGDLATLKAIEHAPGAGCAATMAITSPFALAALERHQLDMELELETHQYSCE